MNIIKNKIFWFKSKGDQHGPKSLEIFIEKVGIGLGL